MKISKEFSVGEELLIEFKNAEGYDDLSCKVKVTEGEPECVSVNGVAEKCKRATPPYISFPADFTVKGWLKLKKTERVKRGIVKAFEILRKYITPILAVYQFVRQCLTKTKTKQKQLEYNANSSELSEGLVLSEKAKL